MRSLSTLFVLAHALPLALAANLNLRASTTTSPRATVADGVVVGTTTSVPSATAVVNKFLGIPFAASPPVRFSPATDPVPWKSPLQATAMKSGCIQQFNSNSTQLIFDNPPSPESEDCLYLNVFAPSTKAPSGGRAVMFWIYGGDLVFGASNVPEYDGASFAAFQDVIVVTSNYRTNVFGFPGSPAIPTDKHNLGLLDQRKALAWVHTNIRAFGGDPAKVTIFGESAGAFSVKQLVALPPTPLPFRAAILESTGATVAGDAAAAWSTLAAALGCPASPDAAQLACVRAADAHAITAILEANALGFVPAVDNITYTQHVELRLAAHTAAPVPLLVGSNANEGSVFALAYPTPDALLASLFPNNSTLQDLILAAYPLLSGFNLTQQILTDFVFTCTTAYLADVAATAGYDVWRYRYSAAFPNNQPFVGAGAWHSSEIQEVFGTYNPTGATAQQVALSAWMQTAWATFAKDPEAGPASGWAKVGSAINDLEELGGDGRTEGKAIAPITVDEACVVFDPIIILNGI